MAASTHLQLDATQLWQAVLGDLQVDLTRTAFDNWLRQTRLIGFQDDVATVAAANPFSVSTLQNRYAPRVERALSEIVGRSVKVTFIVGGDTADPALPGDAPPFAPDETASMLLAGARPLVAGIADSARPDTAPPATAFPTRPPTPRPRAGGRAAVPPPGVGARAPHARPPESRQAELTAAPAHGLNPRYVYETYVVGSSNRFAHAASLSVAEQPGGKYNPFLVHGGVGLGKTHLLHAIGHRALQLRPELTIVYVSSEKFMNDLIDAIRKQRQDEFRGRYREIDILMIDDIQFIAGKESTQEEFFHTFNALYQSGKQVVITSDKPPKAISALEERLRSRFEGGLIADVQLPDYEMRTAILRTKGDELGVAIPADVVEYVAQKDQSNIRELEGALNKVLFRAQVADQPVTLPLAMEALTDATIGSRRAQVTAAAVLDAVTVHYGVALRDLRGRGRTKEIVLPRQVAMFLLREETDGSLVEIGQALGGKDHTTVMHGIKQIKQALGTDAALRTQVMTIREAIFAAAST